MERHEPEPAAESLVVVEVPADRRADVEVRALPAAVAVQRVQLAVHVRHEEPAGAVQDLAEVVDPVVLLQPAVTGGGRRRRLRQPRDLLQLHADAGRDGRRKWIGDGTGLGGRLGHQGGRSQSECGEQDRERSSGHRTTLWIGFGKRLPRGGLPDFTHGCPDSQEDRSSVVMLRQ
jgi:hypothetical protein